MTVNKIQQVKRENDTGVVHMVLISNQILGFYCHQLPLPAASHSLTKKVNNLLVTKVLKF